MLGKPEVVKPGIIACLISSDVAPDSSALRVPDITPPLDLTPSEMPGLIKFRHLASKGRPLDRQFPISYIRKTLPDILLQIFHKL